MMGNKARRRERETERERFGERERATQHERKRRGLIFDCLSESTMLANAQHLRIY
jgi:hypothetical protein